MHLDNSGSERKKNLRKRGEKREDGIIGNREGPRRGWKEKPRKVISLSGKQQAAAGVDGVKN